MKMEKVRDVQLTANLIDISARRIYPAKIAVSDGVIRQIEPVGDDADSTLDYVLPGFIDAHIHIESSMLVPSEFSRMATPHGTVAVVTDPHEIANVMGVAGVEFMLDNSKHSALKCFFGAPSCVPATEYETAGATLDSSNIRDLLQRDDIYYLAEVMNFPGVLAGDAEMLAKIKHAKELGKPVDGHAPGLIGDDAAQYASAGISTDHECTTLAEAECKRDLGMKILIREGSAAKNFEALHPLIAQSPLQTMFCSDDKHPDDLAIGHINLLVRRALELGYDLFDVLQIACINPVEHYGLNVGRLRVGDPADFILVNDLRQWTVETTYIRGQAVAERGKSLRDSVRTIPINRFECTPKSPSAFHCDNISDHVIRAIDGSLVTQREHRDDGNDDPIGKLSVIDRYNDGHPAVAWIRGFGLTQGAIASCVGHDSHNILAVGVDDESLSRAVNRVIRQRGGIAAVSADDEIGLPLPIGGIMSADDGQLVARQYESIDQFAKQALGSTLTAPFMTLSFMALLVIPALKLSDKGLFDAEKFQFVT